MEREARLWGILLISHKPHLLGSQQSSPPSRSPSWNPLQRVAPSLQPFFIHLSKSPLETPPPYQVPLRWKGDPHGERCPHPETFLTYLPGYPVKELPLRPPPQGLSGRISNTKVHPATLVTLSHYITVPGNVSQYKTLWRP